MAMVKATCERCGEVEMTTADLQVRIWITERQDEYAFRCPMCGAVNVKPAEAMVIDVLIASGVETEIRSQPTRSADGTAGPHNGKPGLLRPDGLRQRRASRRFRCM